ncbi:MAG: 16S rRNA (adenine(1518)-N(6)/adenine(1519)-N(6))-dimethyltransferase RsmA [Candidatus Saccharibacteria bacterium]|nr:16S rRNA (adenine(1518)-N(6)/adenine(1519)-N(6))-dimethyltransferase RsmA [Candidatus Saccharibacteria bacterium]
MKNKKSLGQNWLKNREILEEIAGLAGEGKLCVEIGPGLGTLTSSLLRRFEKVIAVEFDADLAAKLSGSFPGKNLEVVNEDILKFDFDAVEGPYVVAGNIPYYITSPIIKKVLEAQNKPERVVLLVQKEVAERIVDERETVLSLFVKNRALVYAGPVVSRAEFTPPPKVDSEVLVMEPYAEPLAKEEVFDLIRRGFSNPRKKLVHNLAGLKSREELERVFEECGISQDARPGEVGLSKWAELNEKLKL